MRLDRQCAERLIPDGDAVNHTASWVPDTSGLPAVRPCSLRHAILIKFWETVRTTGSGREGGQAVIRTVMSVRRHVPSVATRAAQA
jgi:hypothetical protein